MKNFGDLTTDGGVKALNSYLEDKSFIHGYHATQCDVAVFEAIKTAPCAEYNHALRWFNHIKSYGDAKTNFPGEKPKLEQPAAAEAKKVEDEDDIDLFGSDDEVDEAAERLKQERLAAYNAKKSTKQAIIAKSNIILDVKPWDDETDMAKMEECIRTIVCDGLLWGVSKLVPIAFGIKKLQITCVVEDDKVGTDFLEEEITKFEDLVQSVDIAAFNKI